MKNVKGGKDDDLLLIVVRDFWYKGAVLKRGELITMHVDESKSYMTDGKIVIATDDAMDNITDKEAIIVADDTNSSQNTEPELTTAGTKKTA